MRSTRDLRTHQGCLRLKTTGVDLLQRIPAQVIVTIAIRSHEAFGTDTVLLHGSQDLQLIVFGGLIDGRKAFPKLLFYLLPECIDLRA